MTLQAEVIGLYDHAGDANALVYTPLPSAHTYHATRYYTLEISGDEAAARAFVEKVLVESITQKAHFGSTPALAAQSPAPAFILDYGFKPGALDLEKETIMRYFRERQNPGFSLEKLSITQRLYVYAETAACAPQFVKDIVNPAIHRHQVHAA
jgi:hypothetical protein